LAEPAARVLAGGPQASLVAQPALARFIASGAFAVHLRRMRRTYARRQRFLVAELRRTMAGLLEPVPAASGMHLVAQLSPALARRMDDREASRRALAAGIVAPAVSSFSAGAPVRPALLLGFAGFDEETLTAATSRLREALA
jgi:GntR family transcriptional regulator/MocR family aminotransferase